MISNTLSGQGPIIKNGELLIKPLPGQSITNVLNEIKNNARVNIHLSPKRCVSPSMNIWLVEFDYSLIDQSKMLEIIRGCRSVDIAQSNHLITKRSKIPNDTEFSSQWQYINNGSSGGVIDADIDADSAWAITTGGITAKGDTIVVAVIDDGLDLSHPDFTNNLWVNINEIPNNNIDDDGNGYKDDYRGWNADNNNDDISGGGFGGWHGTPVAGIVGARGNNGIGVTGVNWNVKIMVVVGGGDEAGAISTYSYVLANRKLYNNTNGAKGAYVVATNASWGIDNGKPADAPLWCALYDSLGKYGILNAGATANNDVNVDVQGDLPTACPSTYLISVTNTNRQDQKITTAGYGKITIDIGAPGEDTYTVASTSFGGNAYGPFGGTSGATPHVAGTIGLLYSAPCAKLIELSKSKPDTVAFLMKEFILQGSDSNSSLQNISVSGGRLNVHKALIKLQEYCSKMDTDTVVNSINSINLPYPDKKMLIEKTYPNPVVDFLYLKCKITNPENLMISLKNILGQEVKRLEKNNISMNKNIIQLNLSDLPNGMYFISIYNDSTQATLVVVKAVLD